MPKTAKPLLYKIRHFLASYWEVVVFLIVSVGAGTFFTLSIPMGHTEDEQANIVRGYGVSRGHFNAEIINTGVVDGKKVDYYGVTSAPSSLIELQVAGNLSRNESACKIGQSAFPYIDSTDRHYNDAGCTKTPEEIAVVIEEQGSVLLSQSPRGQAATGGASAYSFIGYLPSAVGLFVAQLFEVTTKEAVWFARFGSLLFYVVAIAIALVLLRKSWAKWLVMVTALLPGALVLAVTANVDSVLLPLAILFFACVVRLFMGDVSHKKAKIALIVTAFAIGILLPVLKAPYGVISLALLFVPIYSVGAKGWLQRFGAFCLLAIPALLFNLSIMYIDQMTSYVINPTGDRGGERNIMWMLTDPLGFLNVFLNSVLVADWTSGIGTLTHQRVRLPGLVNIINYVALFSAGVLAASGIARQFKYRKQLFMATAVAGVIAVLALPVLTTARGFIQPDIIAAQGRYFIPMLPFIFLMLGLVCGLQVKRYRWAVISLLAAIAVALAFAMYWYIMQVHVWAL